MKFFSILLTAISMQIFVNAQSSEDSVKQIINGMFTAMKSADSATMQTYFGEGAILQTIMQDKNGGTKIKTEKLNDFLSFINKVKSGEADEQIVFETIKIDGPLAIAWTPYKFYYKGKFSHCGVNSFHLVRNNNSWKINYLIDTRRQKNCD